MFRGSVAALTDASAIVVEKYEYDVFGGTTIKDTSDNVLPESAIGTHTDLPAEG